LLYIAQEVSLLVGYNVSVLVGLQDSNVTRITYGGILVRLDLLPSLQGTHTMPKKLISDASRQSSVTRKKRVTVFASVIRTHQ
jgi:hypothetical protein